MEECKHKWIKDWGEKWYCEHCHKYNEDYLGYYTPHITQRKEEEKPMSKLELKEGVTYRRRNGELTKLTEVEEDVFESTDDSIYEVDDGGHICADSTSPLDLIEIVEDEAYETFANFNKSTGEIVEALNHNEGKPQPTLILKDMQSAFKELLKVRLAGCEKYDRMNWSLSIGQPSAQKFLDDNADSIQRHLLEVLSGEEYDEETGCMHMAQVAIRAMFHIEYVLGGEE